MSTQARTAPQTMSRFVPSPSMDRGQGSGNIGGLFIGIMVAAILGVAVAIPVVLDVINQSNATGTTRTVLDLVPLFIALLLLIALAGPLMRRVR